MKAYRLHEFAGPDAYRLEELASPTPGPGEVLVRIRAVSLNYRDLMISKGVYNPKLRLPLIPLSDGAGEVVVTGAGVTRFKPGERVAASFMPAWVGGQLDDTKARSTLGGDVDGVLAEEVVLPEEGLVRIPEHLSFEEAATLPCAAVTAWHALVCRGIDQARRYDPDPGHRRRLDLRPPVRQAGRSQGHRHVQPRRQARAAARAGSRRADQLQDDPRMGQQGARADRRRGGRSDRRGGRRGDAAAVACAPSAWAATSP